MRKPSRSVPASPKARGITAGKRAEVVPAKWQLFHRKLTELRDSLVAHNRNLLQEAREPIGTAGSHVAEGGTDEFDRDQNLRLAASEQGALQEIEAALLRIKSGTYGICEVSGKSIPLARLRILPWTRYTAKVETEREQGNGKRKAPVAAAPKAKPAVRKANRRPARPRKSRQ